MITLNKEKANALKEYSKGYNKFIIEFFNKQINSYESFSVSFYNVNSMYVVIKLLMPLFNKKQNIQFNDNDKNRIFFKDFNYFCNNENLPYKNGCSFEVLPDLNNYKINIIVNDKDNSLEQYYLTFDFTEK